MKPDPEFITAIYGPRRSGKTCLFYSVLKENGYEDCLYLNFEDIDLLGFGPSELKDLLGHHLELFGRKPRIVLLDEVQEMKDWEKGLFSIYESKEYSLMVTGSSAKLLSREIATSLRGRALKYLLLPLSFREYLDFKDIEVRERRSSDDITRLKRLLTSYLRDGSFPGLIGKEELIPRFYEEYIDLVVYRDLVERYGVQNLDLIKFLIRGVISSYSKELSINRLYNIWQSMGHSSTKRTMYQYFEYLQDAMFVHPLRKFSHSPRTSNLSIPKVYLTDTGAPSHLFGYQEGRAVENALFLENLRRFEGMPSVEMFYWKDAGGECDLVIRDGQSIDRLVQCCYSLNRENYKREISGLQRAGRDLGCERLEIVSWTGEEKVPDDVSIIPLWKYLLDPY
ncbi:MAG: ATP-binding protein [Thermoplasmatota archaeon]